MIWERLLVTFLLASMGLIAFHLFKQVHLRQLNRWRPAITRPTLLYFRSDSCPACPAQSRYLGQLTQDWGRHIAIQQIDAESEPEKARQYRVFTLPTTILLDPAGQVSEINYGLTDAHKLSRQLENLS